MKLSYIDALKMASLDYHVARMLGLAHIDEEAEGEAAFVYLARYYKSNEGNTTTLCSMSLPTLPTQDRLPPVPSLEALTYGLQVNKQTNTPTTITKTGGYAPYEAARYINLNREDYLLEEDYTDTFWSSSREFEGEGDEYIRPYSSGVEYRRQGEPSFDKPEIINDKNYRDTDNIAETVTAIAGRNPIYTHKETNEGIHEYKIYGVNWFARASGLSNGRVTDDTVFLKPNTLLPPINIGSQYIQKESPLLFTSQNEQTALNGRSSLSHPNFVRLTFDWNHIHHSAYQSGQFVELYFRDNTPLKVRGEISTITELGNNKVEVRTRAYTIASLKTPQVVSPVIDSTDTNKFIGRVFAVNGEHYLVDNVQYHASGAIFTLNKNKNRSIQEIVNNEFTAIETYTAPSTGDKFLVVENLSSKSKWTKLNKTIQLKAPTTHTEVIANDDGTNSSYTFGGIIANGTVTDEGQGVYKVVFSGNVLPTITDVDVEWYKGSARMLINGSTNRKTLDCWTITTDGTNTVIYLYDSVDNSLPNSDPAKETIATGSNISVNFHPGYRVYIYPENEPDVSWDNIEPGVGEGTKTTYFAACSVDNTISPSNQSPLSPPVPMIALELTEPQQPQLPIGPTFATRPDFYGKSSFTFDTELTSARPYALLFYRASERAVLDRLYLPETVEEIYQELNGLGDDEFRVNRWQGLMSVETEEDEFIEYNSYAFPFPDNINVNPAFDGETTPKELENEILDALGGTFIPLTTQPVVYDFLKSGYQTSNKKPVLRDSNHELLATTDAAFDPFPMARQVNTSPNEVRFTDYTLDGASKHMYFYCVAEMSDRMSLSARSPILGPIQLVNSFAAEAPSIKQVLTQMEDTLLGLSTGVRFVLNPYTKTEEQQITKVRIYRAFSLEDTYSVRNMQLAATVDYASEVVDTFTDMDFPPFGETLYYRLVALREIKNENGEVEYIPSKPSKTVMTNVIDVVNPTAPSLREQIGANTGSELQDVVLEWDKATHNGAYSLYKMNDVGNWVKIYDIKSNASKLQYPPLAGGAPDFTNYTETKLLPTVDDDDNSIYHRFKVVVENASGLLTLQENILVIGGDSGIGSMTIGQNFIVQ